MTVLPVSKSIVYSSEELTEFFQGHSELTIPPNSIFKITSLNEKICTQLKDDFSKSRISIDELVKGVLNSILNPIGRSLDSFHSSQNIVSMGNLPQTFSISSASPIKITTRIQDLFINMASIYRELGKSKERTYEVLMRPNQKVFIPLKAEGCGSIKKLDVIVSLLDFLRLNVPIHSNVEFGLLGEEAPEVHLEGRCVVLSCSKGASLRFFWH